MGKTVVKSNVTLTLRTMTVFSSNHKSPWITACSFFSAFMKAPIIHCWEKRRPVSADSCRGQGRKNGCIVLLWFIYSGCVFVLLSQVKMCSLDPPCQPRFSFYSGGWKGKILQRKNEEKKVDSRAEEITFQMKMHQQVQKRVHKLKS